MLRPQDTSTRERKNLNGLWGFALDAEGRGRGDRWFAGPLPTAGSRGLREMAVPASYNDVAADAAVRDHVGDVWYQRSVWVPRGWQGRRIVLHVESATHRATVWVDDAEVVSHEGGYTPFEADITDHVRPGQEVRVTVCVNNTLSFQSIPPGVVEDTRAGPRQRCWHDFFNYAGLHRSVWLYATAPAHLTEVASGTGGPRRVAGPVGAPLGARRRLPLRPRAAARRRRRGGGQLPPERRRPHRRRRRDPLSDQRRAVPLHRVRQARGPAGDRQRPQ